MSKALFNGNNINFEAINKKKCNLKSSFFLTFSHQTTRVKYTLHT